MASSSPKLDFGEISALAVSGGYSRNVRLSEMTSALLLSAIVTLRMKWLWQDAILPITEAEFQQINETLDEASWELMTNQIGMINSFVAVQTDDSLLLCDGQSVPQVDYPLLADIVPLSWLSGVNIVLPDLENVGLFGANDSTDVGTQVGANTHQLTVPELATHTHIQNPHSHGYNVAVPVTALGGEIPATANIVTLAPSTTTLTTAVNQNMGDNTPHNNIQESLKVLFYIVAK